MAMAPPGARRHGRINHRVERARPESAGLGRLSLLVWSALAVAVFATLAFWSDPTRLLTSLGDTDDATRMLEVREWMAGASWYDLTISRFGGAHPLVSHWSRLVDLPISVLLTGFEVFLPPDRAELAVRTLWPLLVFWLFVYLLAREAQIRAGRAAALLTIPLAVTCILGVVDFLPGRIDHHNVMTLCAVIGILRLARSFDDASAGWSAGVFLGFGTAVGYEALALTVTTLAASALYGMLPNRSLLGPSRAAVAFAATLAVALAVTTAPESMFANHCDVLSFNLVLLAACAAVGASLVAALENRLSVVAKLSLLAVTGAVGLSLYTAANPACLAGPFGEVDPELFPVWLGSVSETQSIFSLGSQVPTLFVIAFGYFAASLYCGRALMRDDPGDTVRFHILAIIIALPLSFWQIKLIPYATFLPIPLLGIALARPPKVTEVPSSRRRTLIALAAMLALLVFAVSWLLIRMTVPSTTHMKETLQPVHTCQSTPAVSALAELPPGLALTDINLGPYVVALSKLSVLSAPYHRIGKQIIEANRILLAPPEEAERLLRANGVRYVITCAGLDSTTPRGEVPADALQKLLFADKPPAFLEPVPLAAQTPIKVWRIKP